MDKTRIMDTEHDAATVDRVLAQLKTEPTTDAIWDAFRTGWIDEETARALLRQMHDSSTTLANRIANVICAAFR